MSIDEKDLDELERSLEYRKLPHWNRTFRYELLSSLRQARAERDAADRAWEAGDKERERMSDALIEAHRALGGDGEWVAKPGSACAPGDTGDLAIDVPALCEQRQAERDDHRSLLACLADALNIAARENGLPQVERYTDLDAMRGMVDTLAIRASRHKGEAYAARDLAQAESLRAGAAVAEAQGLRAELAEARALLAEVWGSVPGTHDENDPTVRRHARALNALGSLTDYAELVRRLRGQAKGDGGEDFEAANVIEALVRERDHLRDATEKVRECDLSDAVKTLDETIQAENEKLKARVAELELLLSSRCEHNCTYLGRYRDGRKRHAPECLVEEAGL